ncbi:MULTISPECIES: ribosome biogenesis GTPase Der [unclassified Mycoplasma]|uniref:ribosome biogenesis GTPase Der n=1 Tax=unclassified Mycoplasma TaxID=2683645 RepID=UPI00216AD647|nr:MULTISPECIES: ribosome biogenesis GTPase Der [unclassified Mycoplasma]MCS4536683.1 ribosome biogenesis GTPase Der [Mycoplasma sp. CSL7475-4]MCT4469830.1 ribosome biogenesis GTPase Der [Mycoplasma sp. HS2188]
MRNNVIAIIGKPNVGKSTLFNRLVGKKSSITYDEPGVTRDRLYETFEWSGKEIKVIDTGGIEVENRPFQEQIRTQAKIAIDEANVIVFMVDGSSEITNDDQMILSILRKSGKPVIVVANKLDNKDLFNWSWYSLGVDKIFQISAQHGHGVGDVLDECLFYLNLDDEKTDKNFRLSIIGRPNSGKSSLLNLLSGEERSIVSDIAGTTRDSVKTFVTIKDQKFELVDTAGITKKSKIVDMIDKYALMRAISALDESDLSIIMIDASRELSHFDSRIIGYALENSKPIIIAINKWDLIEKETNTMANFEKNMRNKFHFVPWVPFRFISVLQNKRIDKLLETILHVKENLERDVKPSILSNLIRETQLIQPAAPYNGGRLNIYFARKLLNTRIPTFMFYVNNKKFLHWSYERFLEKQIRQMIDFEGTPIKLIFKNKSGLE